MLVHPLVLLVHCRASRACRQAERALPLVPFTARHLPTSLRLSYHASTVHLEPLAHEPCSHLPFHLHVRLRHAWLPLHLNVLSGRLCTEVRLDPRREGDIHLALVGDLSLNIHRCITCAGWLDDRVDPAVLVLSVLLLMVCL